MSGKFHVKKTIKEFCTEFQKNKWMRLNAPGFVLPETWTYDAEICGGRYTPSWARPLPDDQAGVRLGAANLDVFLSDDRIRHDRNFAREAEQIPENKRADVPPF